MHNRITETTTTLELYNPINFIIDNRVRDIGEYLTEKLYQDTGFECSADFDRTMQDTFNWVKENHRL